MGISTKDSLSVYNLEVAFGTSFGILLLVVLALVIIIWIQRKQIARLIAFFNGQQPEERRPIYNRLNRNDQDSHEDEDYFNLTVVNNQHAPLRFHQNANIAGLIELIFPRELDPQQHIRNITALRAFHKCQRDALKAYVANQEVLFRQAEHNHNQN